MATSASRSCVTRPRLTCWVLVACDVCAVGQGRGSKQDPGNQQGKAGYKEKEQQEEQSPPVSRTHKEDAATCRAVPCRADEEACSW